MFCCLLSADVWYNYNFDGSSAQIFSSFWKLSSNSQILLISTALSVFFIFVSESSLSQNASLWHQPPPPSSLSIIVVISPMTLANGSAIPECRAEAIRIASCASSVDFCCRVSSRTKRIASKFARSVPDLNCKNEVRLKPDDFQLLEMWFQKCSSLL